MTTEHPCGRIGLQPITKCADRAAEVIASAREKLAVCLSPEGFVTVEAIEHAILAEMVDVYMPSDGWFVLWASIEDDLAAACKERGITGGRGHRHRVMSERRAA
ncbi:MAG TPA: hypothetical protein VGV14_19535 [Rhodanobacter sp.]|nr:hypothetical protein [Xanthomonadaceae bacterium]HEV2682700.1 hypothetical protein [Rhodanobacter sp.]